MGGTGFLVLEDKQFLKGFTLETRIKRWEKMMILFKSGNTSWITRLKK
ncbi:MAG: hypothetical protein GX024_04755 [Clostridiales bacterium]|nr:hypothetical protein [Clostridiales bacterium]